MCAKEGLECVIYMGEKDMERQALNVFRMRLLGAEVRPVTSGTRTLKDATSEAIRDWVTNVESTHYILGSVAGPHPFPMMVRDFHACIGRETRRQAAEKWGGKPDILVACVGGGSNAMGLFHEFVDDADVRLIGVEAGEQLGGRAGERANVLGEGGPANAATGVCMLVCLQCIAAGSNRLTPLPSAPLRPPCTGGEGIDTPKHAATMALGRPGVLHGSFSLLIQDDEGQVVDPHSISAGCAGVRRAGVSKRRRSLPVPACMPWHSACCWPPPPARSLRTLPRLTAPHRLDYPGVGPEHSFLQEIGRAEYHAVTGESEPLWQPGRVGGGCLVVACCRTSCSSALLLHCPCLSLTLPTPPSSPPCPPTLSAPLQPTLLPLHPCLAADNEALGAFQQISRLEGIIPALETSHAFAYLDKLCPTLPHGTRVVVNCSGRGDKDVTVGGWGGWAGVWAGGGVSGWCLPVRIPSLCVPLAPLVHCCRTQPCTCPTSPPARLSDGADRRRRDSLLLLQAAFCCQLPSLLVPCPSLVVCCSPLPAPSGSPSSPHTGCNYTTLSSQVCRVSRSAQC